MNLYVTAVVIRRFAGIAIAISAVLFGRQVLAHEEAASVDHSVEAAQKSFDGSNTGAPKNIVVSRDGSKVTVKGLPTAGN